MIKYVGRVGNVACYESVLPLAEDLSVGEIVRLSGDAERAARGDDYRGPRITVDPARVRRDPYNLRFLEIYVSFTTRQDESEDA